jgi:hypothetical protein
MVNISKRPAEAEDRALQPGAHFNTRVSGVLKRAVPPCLSDPTLLCCRICLYGSRRRLRQRT